jgi:hypothetical protein
MTVSICAYACTSVCDVCVCLSLFFIYICVYMCQVSWRDEFMEELNDCEYMCICVY